MLQLGMSLMGVFLWWGGRRGWTRAPPEASAVGCVARRDSARRRSGLDPEKKGLTRSQQSQRSRRNPVPLAPSTPCETESKKILWMMSIWARLVRRPWRGREMGTGRTTRTPACEPRDGETTMPTTTLTPRERKLNAILWTAQVLLALLFLFAGGMKLVASPEMLKGPGIQFPLLFLRFIGVCEF